MTAETKAYIEQYIDLIENGGVASAYLNCPLRILNDFNNTLHYADIDYPPVIHIYVVTCCYLSARFKGIRLNKYDFDYKTETEEFDFTCDFYKYDVERVTHDLSILLPKNSINVEVEELFRGSGQCVLAIHVKIH